MRVIDCSAMIGYGVVNHTVVNHEGFTLVERVAEARDAGEMLAYMDYCGIESAIVGHQAMIDVTPTYGNQKLVKETAKCPERLIPSWTILPLSLIHIFVSMLMFGFSNFIFPPLFSAIQESLGYAMIYRVNVGFALTTIVIGWIFLPSAKRPGFSPEVSEEIY